MSDEGVNLNERETRCLALRIAMQHLVDSGRWLEWEDYPMLGEYAFERLDESVRTEIAQMLRDELRATEKTWKIDSALLMERAS